MTFEQGVTLAKRIRTKSNTKRKRVRAGMLAVALGVTVTVVASTPSTSSSNAVTAVKSNAGLVASGKAVKLQVTKRWFEIGKASWYGGDFNGRRTANGEHFDMTAWTCAHRTLPLGSWVRVTNMNNRKSIFLRVNDRGPVAENLIVDLSLAAARKIGISGLGKVKLEPVAANDPRLIDQMVATVKPMPPPQWPVARGLGR